MAIWIILAIGLITSVPSDSKFTPALWIHASSTLILLLLIKRLGGDLLATLRIKRLPGRWILIAVMAALIFWIFDHWLINDLFNINTQVSISHWQQTNVQYWPMTVFVGSVILAPLFEELFFRGLLFNHLKSIINPWFAAFVSALLFALIHWSWPEFISVFFAGILYAWLTHQSKSVITPLIAHTLHNFMTYLYFNQNLVF